MKFPTQQFYLAVQENYDAEPNPRRLVINERRGGAQWKMLGVTQDVLVCALRTSVSKSPI
jgi:hypothetical protein